MDYINTKHRAENFDTDPDDDDAGSIDKEMHDYDDVKKETPFHITMVIEVNTVHCPAPHIMVCYDRV